MFQKLGLASPEIERGLLVLVSREERRAGIHVSDSWPAELRVKAEAIFRDTAIAGLSRGSASRGILAFIEGIDALLRSTTLARDRGGPTGARPQDRAQSSSGRTNSRSSM